jgi:hypothetical protein
MSEFSWSASTADKAPAPRRDAEPDHAGHAAGYAKPVGVALTGQHLAALLADRGLAARLNASGLAFAIAGIDRVDRGLPRQRQTGGGTGTIVEPSVAAAMLAAQTPDLGWLAAAVHRNAPGSLARRAVPADYLPGGRPGVLLGLNDQDAEAGPQQDPVLAWRVENTGEAAAASRVADILIWPAGRPDRLGLIAAAGSGVRLFLEIPAGGVDLGARLAGHLADARVAGVVLRPWGTESALREFAVQVLPGLAGSGAFRNARSGALRERLSLPAATARPAIPSTEPDPQRAFAAW